MFGNALESVVEIIALAVKFIRFTVQWKPSSSLDGRLYKQHNATKTTEWRHDEKIVSVSWCLKDWNCSRPEPLTTAQGQLHVW